MFRIFSILFIFFIYGSVALAQGPGLVGPKTEVTPAKTEDTSQKEKVVDVPYKSSFNKPKVVKSESRSKEVKEEEKIEPIIIYIVSKTPDVVGAPDPEFAQ